MRKILSLLITISLLITNVTPIYADLLQPAIKKSVKNVISKTYTELNKEIYGEDYVENYEKTLQKLVTNLKDSNKFTFEVNVNNDYIENEQIIVDYNDDGKSILLNVRYSDEIMISIFVNDEYVLFESDGEKSIYNFGNTEDSDDFIESFTYSNIKAIIDTYFEIITDKDFDKIKENYYDHLLDYVIKGQVSKKGNTVSVSINGDLIRAYLNSLSKKISNDADIKKIMKKYDFDIMQTTIQTIDELAESVDSGYSFVYTGEIKDDMLIKNKFESIYVPIEEDYTDKRTITLNFSDSKDGLLSDFYYCNDSEYYEEKYEATGNLKNSEKGKTLSFDIKENDETIMTTTMNYNIDKLTFSADINSVHTVDKYLYIKEEPVKPEPISYKDWYEINVTDGISSINEEIKALDVAINKGKERLKTPTESFYVDSYVAYNYDFMNFVGYDEFLEVVDSYGSLKVIQVEKYNDFLIKYKNNLSEEISKLKMVTEKNYKDEYFDTFDTSLEMMWYEDDLASYKEYIDALANGETKDITNIIHTYIYSISDEELNLNSTQSQTKNGENLNEYSFKFTLKKSNTNNTVDITGATSY